MLERYRRPAVVAAALVAAVVSTVPGVRVRAAGVSPRFQDVRQNRLAAPTSRSARLEPGQVVDRELRAGGTDTYEVMVPAGHIAHLVIEQGATDLTVRLTAPGGSSAEVDGRWHGPEPVSLVPAVAGVHRVEVRPLPGAPAAVRYSIRLEELRPVRSEDEQQADAERLSTEVKRAIQDGTAQSLAMARQRAERLVALWRTVGDRYGEAQSLHTLGFIANAFGQNQPALALYDRALDLWRELGHEPGELQTLSNIGHVHTQLGNLARAVSTYEQVIATRRRTGDSRGIAVALNNLAVTHTYFGELERALEQLDEALSLWRALGDRDMQGAVAANAAATLVGLGRFEEALQRYDDALPLLESQDPRRLGAALSNVGNLHRLLGDYDAALRRFGQARALGSRAGDPRVEAFAVHQASVVSQDLKETARARDGFREALGLWQRAGDRRGEAMTLARMGEVASETGALDTALDHHGRALALIREIGDARSEAGILDGMARTLLARGEATAAHERLVSALALSREVGDRPLEAQILLDLSSARQAEGELEHALSHIEQAVQLIESLRGGVVSPAQRMTYLASAQSFYEAHVDLLMQLHRRNPSGAFDAQAFEAAERGRARTLLDLLAEARADIRQGIDPALAARERSLRQRLDAKAERQSALLSSPATQAQGKALGAELDALLEEYRALQAQIRRSNSRLAALDEAKPVDLSALRRELDADTALLAFALGDKRSFAWAITRDGIRSAELPGRAMVEEQARRVYVRLAPGSAPPSSDDARSRPTSGADTDPAIALTRMILVPVAASLQVRRLVVVPAGALQYVPFAVLPHPNPPHAPLLASYEIVNLPSASVLPTLRGGEHAAPPRKVVAVLADPVFSPNDSRLVASRQVARNAAAAPSPVALDRGTDALNRSAIDVGVTETNTADLPRLPFSRREAEAIVSLAGASRSVMAVDFAASRALATGASLADYRIVHFATHGLLNAAHPELSGLVLSLVDGRGRPQAGFLRLHDIYNLQLRADLVVLSACHTALGREVKGEGLVGLTRGFLYSGARRVVASLWKVDDEATAELMREFYRSMLLNGVAPAAALRTAQLSLQGSRRWQSPRYWAAFVLQGDWR